MQVPGDGLPMPGVELPASFRAAGRGAVRAGAEGIERPNLRNPLESMMGRDGGLRLPV
jgi:hypothetical protein